MCELYQERKERPLCIHSKEIKDSDSADHGRSGPDQSNTSVCVSLSILVCTNDFDREKETLKEGKTENENHVQYSQCVLKFKIKLCVKQKNIASAVCMYTYRCKKTR